MAWIQTQFHSKACRIPMAVDVIIPEKREDGMPVLYLLHDYGQNQSYWIRKTRVEQFADQYGTAVVMPQGNNSFYRNTDSGRMYEEFLTEELPRLCGTWFGFGGDRKATGIGGIGMGGYGAVHTALKAPELFGKVCVWNGALPYEQGDQDGKQRLSHLLRMAEERSREIPEIFSTTNQSWFFRQWGEICQWFDEAGVDITFCASDLQGIDFEDTCIQVAMKRMREIGGILR